MKAPEMLKYCDQRQYDRESIRADILNRYEHPKKAKELYKHDKKKSKVNKKVALSTYSSIK